MRVEIPDSLAALTPAWLTERLRAGGLLGEARVARVSPEVLGEGEGFVGLIARLHLDFDRDAPGAPHSVIAKLPTPVPENRATGELLGAYEREILFYRELAPRVPLRTPRCFAGEMDDVPGARHGPAIVGFVDRLPEPGIRALLVLFRWVARHSRRRYVLLLEDLAPARVGDQVAGCAPERCRAVLVALARAQAALWESPLLQGRHWIPRLDLGVRIGHLEFRRWRTAFCERFAAQLGHWALGTLDWLDANAVAMLRALHGGTPQTLVHGDFRLDNLFFAGDGSPIAVDWQGVARGPGVFDVAYFLSGALAADVSTEVERELLGAWHVEVQAAGVSGYPLEACVRDYERSLLALLHRMVTVDILEMGSGRGADLVDLWVERLLRRLRDVDLDAALAGDSPGSGARSLAGAWAATQRST